jgi:hypothetical protein
MESAITPARMDVVDAAVVITVMFAVATVFGPWPVTLAWPQLAPVGKPLQVKLTAVVKLLDAMMPGLTVPEEPGLVMLTYGGRETKAKPG